MATSTESAVTPLRDKDDPSTVREPPHNYDAEQALLGAILVNNLAYGRVSEFLRPEHFANPDHGRIYDACGKLIERGQIADPITLRNYLEQNDGLAEVGGPPYLARLAASAVTIINAADYGRMIFDLALRRELINMGEGMVNDAFDHDPETGAMDQIEGAEQKLFDLATIGEIEGGFAPFTRSLTSAIEIAEAAYKRDGKLTGIATGFAELDQLLGGLQASDLIVLAGRPSMGKTALATNIAFHAAKSCRLEKDDSGQDRVVDGAVVGFFSLEMSAEQLATRMLAEESGVASDKIRKGKLSNDDFQNLVKASRMLSSVPFFIDDSPALSVATIRTRARRLKRLNNLSLVVIDYLQLLYAPTRRGAENRVQEVSEITRGLKALAKELDVPVLALSQLSRAVEQRDDKRPQLSDLRESGSIEQDADVVMFIFREEYYLSRQEPEPGTEKHVEWLDKMDRVHNLSDINIAKQRQGPIGNFKLHFESKFTKFQDFVRDDHLPDATD